MRIFVEADYLVPARAWFGGVNTKVTLDDIARWASAQEAAWGECYIFVEVSIPGHDSIKASNVDLIIAFSDRVAVCEIKNHRTLQAIADVLLDSLGQSNDNANLIKAHLKTGRVLPQEAVRPFLFVPGLVSEEIAALISKQLAISSHRHVVIGGGDRCKKQPVLPSGHPVCFSQCIQSRLHQMRIRRGDPSFPGAQGFILRLLEATRLHEFSDVSKATAFLRTESNIVPQIRIPEDHLSGLHADEMKRALEILSTIGTLEVEGPFGGGKTSFIREILNTLAKASPKRLSIAQFNANGITSYKGILSGLVQSFNLDADPYGDEEYLADTVFQFDGLVWIQSFDRVSMMTVRRLWERVRQHGDRQRCRIIVESRSSLFGDPWTNKEHSVFILGVPLGAMPRLLELRKPGSKDRTLGTFAESRNPRLALARWQPPGGSDPTPDVLADLAWFQDVFQGFEREVAGFLVCLLDESPIPLRLSLAISLTLAAFPGQLYDSVVDTTYWVLPSLHATDMTGFLCVFSWPCERMPVLQVLRQETMVASKNRSLAEHVRQTSDRRVLSTIIERAMSSLTSSEEADTLEAKVLLAARQGDIEPFCRSVYRRGYYGAARLTQWLDKPPAIVHDTYLERFCRFAARVLEHCQRRQIPPPAELLDEPESESTLHRYLWQVATIVSESFEPEGPSLDRFAKATRNVADPNARTEALCWLSNLSRCFNRSAHQQRQFLQQLQEHSSDQSLSWETRLYLMTTTIAHFDFGSPGFWNGVEPGQHELCHQYFNLAATNDAVDLWEAFEIGRLYGQCHRKNTWAENWLAHMRFTDDGNHN